MTPVPQQPSWQAIAVLSVAWLVYLGWAWWLLTQSLPKFLVLALLLAFGAVVIGGISRTLRDEQASSSITVLIGASTLAVVTLLPMIQSFLAQPGPIELASDTPKIEGLPAIATSCRHVFVSGNADPSGIERMLAMKQNGDGTWSLNRVMTANEPDQWFSIIDVGDNPVPSGDAPPLLFPVRLIYVSEYDAQMVWGQRSKVSLVTPAPTSSAAPVPAPSGATPAPTPSPSLSVGAWTDWQIPPHPVATGLNFVIAVHETSQPEKCPWDGH